MMFAATSQCAAGPENKVMSAVAVSAGLSSSCGLTHGRIWQERCSAEGRMAGSQQAAQAEVQVCGCASQRADHWPV